MNYKKCVDCDCVLHPNNKSGYCKKCYAQRKKPKLENAQEVKELLATINNYTNDAKRMR